MISIRRKLIEWIAGGMPVVLNVHISGQTIFAYGGDNMLIQNVIINGVLEGPAIQIKERGDELSAILSLPENLSGIQPK